MKTVIISLILFRAINCFISFDIFFKEQDKEFEIFFQAIQYIETGGEKNPFEAIGDGGRSLGPYQISKDYWTDSNTKGQYRFVKNKYYSRKVMKNYWNRYCKEELKNKNFEVLARVHNGGPKGMRKTSTKDYWKKIKAYINK